MLFHIFRIWPEKRYLKFLRSRYEKKYTIMIRKKNTIVTLSRVADADKKERNKVQEMQLNEWAYCKKYLSVFIGR